MVKSSWNCPLLWVSLASALAGCSTAPENQGPASPPLVGIENPTGEPIPQAEPPSRSGNPDTYKVFGRRYQVKETSEGYREQGIASWYGWSFHGRKTSSGPLYDMFDLTAAHKTLPIPTYVRVTNLENGRNVVVKVNDRGPFVGKRILDLSYAAASRLDMLGRGTAQVEVVALEPYQFIPALAARRADARERLASRFKRPEPKPQFAGMQVAQAPAVKIDSHVPALRDAVKESAPQRVASHALAIDSAAVPSQAPWVGEETVSALEAPTKPRPSPQVASLDQMPPPPVAVTTPTPVDVTSADGLPIERDLPSSAVAIVDKPALRQTAKSTPASQSRKVERPATRALAQIKVVAAPTPRPTSVKVADKSEARGSARPQPPLRLAAADLPAKAGALQRPANPTGNKQSRTLPAKTENAAKRPAEERSPRLPRRDARPQAGLATQEDVRISAREVGTAKATGIRLVSTKSGRGRIMAD